MLKRIVWRAVLKNVGMQAHQEAADFVVDEMWIEPIATRALKGFHIEVAEYKT